MAEHDQHALTKKNNKLMVESDRKREGQRTKRVSGDFQFGIDRSYGKKMQKMARKSLKKK